MGARSIYLICNSFPSKDSVEKNFISSEVMQLSLVGYRIVLVPFKLTDVLDGVFSGNVTVSSLLSDEFNMKNYPKLLFSLLFSCYFWKEIIRNFIPIILSFSKLKNFIKYSLKAEATYRALVRLSPDGVIYSYWCTGESVGASIYSSNYKKLILITRMHGYDLYKDRDCNRGYIPYRQFVLNSLDRIFLLSNSSLSSLVNDYKVKKSKIIISPLGASVQPDVLPKKWSSSKICFYSCSYPSPVKRLDLIFRVISEISIINPYLDISWNHFGCVEEQLDFTLTPVRSNLCIKFRGVVSTEFFLQEYKRCQTPIFINLSKSEGQPVAIMEAMSCALPVVATSVGGVVELVGDEGGLLVSPRGSAYDIACEISQNLLNANSYENASIGALDRQRMYYDSEKNHERFALFIDGIDNDVFNEKCTT